MLSLLEDACCDGLQEEQRHGEVEQGTSIQGDLLPLEDVGS